MIETIGFVILINGYITKRVDDEAEGLDVFNSLKDKLNANNLTITFAEIKKEVLIKKVFSNASFKGRFGDKKSKV